eukprot:scaffold11019_cov75-Phaeocystis_antarctica.AAC.9
MSSAAPQQIGGRIGHNRLLNARDEPVHHEGRQCLYLCRARIAQQPQQLWVPLCARDVCDAAGQRIGVVVKVRTTVHGTARHANEPRWIVFLIHAVVHLAKKATDAAIVGLSVTPR